MSDLVKQSFLRPALQRTYSTHTLSFLPKTKTHSMCRLSIPCASYSSDTKNINSSNIDHVAETDEYDKKRTHFGFQTVLEDEKVDKGSTCNTLFHTDVQFMICSCSYKQLILCKYLYSLL